MRGTPPHSTGGIPKTPLTTPHQTFVPILTHCSACALVPLIAHRARADTRISLACLDRCARLEDVEVRVEGRHDVARVPEQSWGQGQG